MNRKFLLNISVVELTRRLLLAGEISVRGFFLVFIYYLKFIIALPGASLQFLFYARKIKRTVISKDPVFILGHYRSGTTYLHKLMMNDERFGYLSNYEMILPFTNLLFGKWMKQFLQFSINKLQIKNDFFNNSIVQLRDPCEEDRFLMGRASVFSAYWGFIFPKRSKEWLNCAAQFRDPEYVANWKKEYMHTLKLITFKNKGRQIVSKNPPNTGRIKHLLEMFPNAKFIYIRRNPFHLFYSMRNMWIKGIFNNYCLQKISNEQLEELIFEHFEYLMDKYESDKNFIPEQNLIEVRYEELESVPLKVLRRIYSKLELPDFKTAASDFVRQVQKEKHYQKSQYNFDEDTFRRIEKRWEKYIEQWECASTELIT